MPRKSVTQEAVDKIQGLVVKRGEYIGEGQLRLILGRAFRKVRADERKKIIGSDKPAKRVTIPFAGGQYKCKLVLSKRKKKRND